MEKLLQEIRARELSPENLFNLFCLINSLIVLLHASIYLSIGMTTRLMIIDSIGIILLSGCFYLSYFHNLFRQVFWPFVVFSQIDLSLLWFELNGMKGPVLLVFYTLMMFYSAIDEQKNQYRLALIVFFTVFVNILLEYFGLVEVTSFETFDIFIFNAGLLLIGTLFSVGIITRYINLRFKEESAKLSNKSLELREAINDLESNNECLEVISQFQDSFLQMKTTKFSFHFLLEYMMDFTKSEYGLIAEIHLIDQAPIANVFYVSGENWSNDEEVLINKNVDQWLRSFKFNDLLKLLIQSGNSLIQQDYVDDQATLFKNIRLISTEGQGEINGVVAFFNADFPFQEKSQQIAPYVTAVSTAIENLRLKRMSKIYEKELLYAKEIAEENVRIKSQFLSNVSKELKQPLSMISGPITSVIKLESEQYKEEQVRESLALVLDNSHRIMSFIDNIMRSAKIRSNNLELLKVQQKLFPFLNTIVLRFKEQYKSSNIQFNFNFEADRGVELCYDFKKLETILNTLLSNAFKYTPDEGSVQLHVSHSGNNIKIAIRDNGIGFHEEDLEHVFERYYRFKNNKDIVSNGTSISLSVAQDLAKLQGFELKVRSKLEHGSSFWFDLKYNQIKEDTTLALPTFSGDNKALPAHKKEPTGQQRILFVEDHQSMRTFVKGFLESFYTMDLAEHGKQAIQLLKRNKYDLVISDLMMPVMDGFSLIKWMKSEAKFTEIPIVVLTAMPEEEDKINVLSIGVDEYLLKPFVVDELLIRIKNLLANSKIRRLWKQKQKEGWAGETGLLRSEIAKRTESGVFQQSQEDKLKLKEAEQIIVENLNNKNFNVQVLAKKIAMSKRQLYRFMKLRVGMTPLAFIKEVKLQQARKILESKSAKDLKEVAQASGFKTVRNFSNNFEKRYGKKPSVFFK